MRVDDVAKELGVSKSYAYKIVQKLNTELRSMGYLPIPGRVDRKYFCEKLFYNGKQKNYREDVSHNSAIGGFGIGLSMGKEIAERLGGKIKVIYADKTISFIVEL